MASTPADAFRRTASFLGAAAPVLRHLLLAALVEAGATLAHLPLALHGLLALVELLAVRHGRRRP